MKLINISLLLIPILSFASPACEEGNAIPTTKKVEAELLGIKWMENAIYCNFGTFQILAPLNKKSDLILIYKNNKIFVMHQKGFGLNFFQEFIKNKPAPSVTVQDWNNDGIYERLDYSLIDNNGNVVGNVQDKTMDGNINVIKFKK